MLKIVICKLEALSERTAGGFLMRKQDIKIELYAFGCTREMKVPFENYVYPKPEIHIPHRKPDDDFTGFDRDGSPAYPEPRLQRAVFKFIGTRTHKGYPMYYFSHLE